MTTNAATTITQTSPNVDAQLAELAALKAENQRQADIKARLMPMAKKYPSADLELNCPGNLGG